MVKRLILIAAVSVMAANCNDTTFGQLRIVTHNTLVKPTTVAEQTLARTIYGAIEGRAANGIAKRPDLIALQEQESTVVVDTTDQMITALEAEFGVNSYSKVILSSGTVRQSYVYDSAVLTPIDSVEISLGIRPALRTEWQLAGYDSNSRFYTYCVHFKAGNTGSDISSRSVSSTLLRNNSNALGEDVPIIYLGDFNFSGHTEAGFSTLIGPGNGQPGNDNGQAFDPVELTTWPGLVSRAYLTQSTRSSSLPDGGAAGGMDDRFDLQLVTDELLDGEGMSYLGPSSTGFAGENSYVAFGNDGQIFNVAINSFYNGREQPMNVLDALHDFSDHVPVVADYQIPARMEVAIDPIPPAIIVGANVSIDFDVTNTAPVDLEVAADELDYVFLTSGDISGAGGGTDPATGGGQTESFALDAGTVGIKSGTLTVDGISQQTSDPESITNIDFDVLDHATPSFSDLKEQDTLVIDMGDVPLGSMPAGTNFSIFNLASQFGANLTANLNLDSVMELDPDQKFSFSGPPVVNLPAEQGETFTIDVAPDEIGAFSATFDFNLSDENLPGETTSNLSLVVMVNVVPATILGDMNGDGTFDNLDVSAFVLALTDPAAHAAQFPGVDVVLAGDFNDDGSFDNVDISGFVDALTGG